MTGSITVVSRFDRKQPGAIRKMITRSASPVGNSWAMADDSEAERNRVCDEFDYLVWADWLTNCQWTYAQRDWMHARVDEYLQGCAIELCCQCAPKRCHGDTLRGAILHLAEEELQTRTERQG